MLEFPLPESFFPQVVLNAEEVRYYKRLGKERLNELIRIAEDAELAYKWTDIRTPKTNTTIQKTQFLDMRPATKATFASTLIKCSILVPDTRPEEVLLAIARTKTKEARKMMTHLHGQAFVDGRTLFKFPSSIASSRPDYSYRAIKWCAFQGKGGNGSATNKLDFSYLEYAGKRKPAPGSMVVGFCLQESIQREREIPLLENFGFVRGYLSRSGIIVSKTHQPNVVRITSICQIDGDIEPLVRNVLEGIMQDMVGSVVKLRGLLDRQRVSTMKFLEQWEWVANGDRKACAVCLKGFFFHRKHHCRACGEVVCSSCAPLRALDEPIYDIKELRICTACMTKAGRTILPVEASQDRHNNQINNDTLTSDGSSQDFQDHSRGHQPRRNDERQFIEHENKDLMRRPSDAAARLLQADNSQKGTPKSKSKRRLSTFMKNPRETVQTLSHLVDQIRDARDTINITISETGESRLSFGEEDAYTELYDQMTRLRDTVELSANGRGEGGGARRPSSGGRRSSLAGKSKPPPTTNPHPNDPDTLEYRFSEEDVKDDFNAVVEKTFAAAAATRAVGKAVLSSCASDQEGYSDLEEEAIDDILPSPSEASGYSSSDREDDQYSTARYDRVMGNLSQQQAKPSYDDGYSNPSSSLRSQQSNHPLRGSRVHLLEKKIEDLQRDLLHAQRKLSYFEADEPDPEYGNLGTLHEDPMLTPEDSLVMRVQPRPIRRPSDFTRSPAPPNARGRTRPQSEGLARANLASRRSMDIGSLERRQQRANPPGHGEYKRRGSEFTPRTSMPGSSRASVGNRAHSTADMVSELFSVMNPTEIAKTAGPPLRKSSSSGSRHTSTPSQATTRSSSPGMPLKRPSRPPPPPPPSTEMLYVDSKGRLLTGRSRSGSSLGSPDEPSTGYGLDKTASSSASYLDQSRGSTGGGPGQRRHDSFGSAHYRDHLGDENPADEEETSSDDNDVYARELEAEEEEEEEEPEERLPRRRPSSGHPGQSPFFGDMNNGEQAFFGQHVAPPPSSSSRPPSRRGSLAAAPSPPPPRRPSMAARGGRDESEELRDLMEGLVKPRSTSMPFREGDSYYDRPSWSDGPRRQSSSFARDPPQYHSNLASRYDRPDPYAPNYNYPRRPGSTSTRSGSQLHTASAPSVASRRSDAPRAVDSAVSQVRGCLSSLHSECPSQWERHRKLQSISKILKSLQRDGVRSKFRSLSHEEFQYDRVLEETPSIVQLLRLAGYVSQPQKLVMRNVNQEYIAVLLREIDDELNEMQATQDYL